MTNEEAVNIVLNARKKHGSLPFSDALTYGEADDVFKAAEVLARNEKQSRRVIDNIMRIAMSYVSNTAAIEIRRAIRAELPNYVHTGPNLDKG